MHSTDKDEVRSMRWRPDAWEALHDLCPRWNENVHGVANKAVLDAQIREHNSLKNFPPPAEGAGVSTYRATIEFQLPAMIWADEQAYGLFFDFIELLKSHAPNRQEAYGQIDAIRPMQYDARLGDLSLPGAHALHKMANGDASL